ncbi:MAG: DUF3500 domain-containing protein [Gemmatimonadaceae bacterium]
MFSSRTARVALLLGLFASSALGLKVASRWAATAMADAASRFLGALTVDQRTRATFAFDSDERMRWHFIPPETFPRKGVTLKELSTDQRATVHALLRTGLSQRGYMTATAIMELEQVLRALERSGRMARDHEEYYVSIFGNPSAEGTWGWRFEGHHLSLHFTIVRGSSVVSSPAFLGSNPAEVRDGPMKGQRVLAVPEDAGRAVVMALDASQRAKAVVSDTAPPDIITSTRLPIDPLTPAGIPASELSADQRALLQKLVEAYTSLMADDIAAQRLARLREAGLDKLNFAWAGTLERGGPHYYRVQGPTLLIEYDNTQNNANHIHSVWRDFARDFGRDLLREHVREMPHGERSRHGGDRP